MTQQDEEQQIQQAQYEYPYHYLPRVEDGRFSQLQYWSWGMHYLGGMRVVQDCLADIAFESLIDVGCGDGRFLREVRQEYPSVDVLGVDYSERSIAMARGMNPDIDYEVHDLLEESIDKTFDVVTSIEVLEHIPPEDCQEFITEMAQLVTDEGHLVLTVPHENKPVADKHYQHFTSDDLDMLIGDHFTSVEYVPFDRASKIFTSIELALGGRGNHVVINTPLVVNAVWTLYQHRYLYAPDEGSCRRIAAICER